MFSNKICALVILVMLASSAALAQTSAKKATSQSPMPHTAKGPATVAEAEAFMKNAEAQIADLTVRASRASWVQENFITDDTETMSAQANEKLTAVVTELASKLDGMYGKGKYCKQVDGKEKCLSLNDLSRIMASSTNPDELLDAWVGWHKISIPMKDKYARFVQLSNMGAKELGFQDTGSMWRSNYDMSPEQFSAEVERLWRQVEPFYVSLHTYVRKQLIKKYGKAAERPDGLIPAHLLGNMWAQEWGNIYPLVAPADSGQGYDLTQLLKDKKVDELGMVRYGENFFKSLGFAELPKTF